MDSHRSDHFDMKAYQGRWYEIARYPFLYDISYGKVYTEYTYQPDSKTFKTKITGFIAAPGELSDKLYIEEGLMWNRESDLGTGKFRIKTLEPVGEERDYWVLETDYTSYALIGNSAKTHFCILSRTPNISRRILNMLLEKALQYGYELNFIEIDYRMIY